MREPGHSAGSVTRGLGHLSLVTFLAHPLTKGARDQEVVQFCTMHVIVTTLWGAEKILEKGCGMKSRQQGMQEASRASQLIAETQFPPL